MRGERQHAFSTPLLRIMVLFALAIVGVASPAIAQSATTEAQHRFLAEALPRAEASYGGALITDYGGKDCQSTLTFGNAKLSVDWTKITDTAWVVGGGNTLELTGRFDSNAIEKRSVKIVSNDLAMRIATAAGSLRKACDPLKASGF